jgi:segregation and condensation protein B
MPETADSRPTELKHIIEALLLAAGSPLSLSQLMSLFEGHEAYSSDDVGKALEALSSDLRDRGIELVEVSSGFRLQTRRELIPWVSRLWEERPQRYSRALLETLALIAYRQPITRGEIEEVRGVSVRSNIIRTLQEREWVRVVGHRDVPGKPALFGTTRAFLDYFNLLSLDELPTLAEIKDMESLEPELDFDPGSEPSQDDEAGAVVPGPSLRSE